MRDAKRKELQPPIQRSWLRLRAGKMYYAAKRYLLWYGRPGIHWAKERQTELLPEIQYQHATPLLRQLRGEEVELQYNKITNLKLAAARLNGVVLRPGETFSYWRLIGKPTRQKGYQDGMVLFLGHIGRDVGGGLCQLSNLIFWMTLHTPLTVVERYRHSHDVFPDANRTQPFGSGATCAYPHRDLMIFNGTQQNFQLCLSVGQTHLIGEWRAELPVQSRYHIAERNPRIEQAAWGGYIRHNELIRQVFDLQDGCKKEEFLFANDAIMMYSPLLPQAEAGSESST
ncbi:VanW family protein [Dysosmobacter sp.]